MCDPSFDSVLEEVEQCPRRHARCHVWDLVEHLIWNRTWGKLSDWSHELVWEHLRFNGLPGIPGFVRQRLEQRHG